MMPPARFKGTCCTERETHIILILCNHEAIHAATNWPWETFERG